MDEADLAEKIAALRSDPEYAGAKVAMLADAGSLDKELAGLRSDKDAYLFGVDNKNLKENSYIRVVKMLRIVVDYAVSGKEPRRDDPELPFKDSDGIRLFVPNADIFDGDLLRRLYIEMARFA
jgi:hypothetical protein